MAEPWMTAEVAGPLKASLIAKPEAARAIVRRAEHPLMAIGHLATEVEVDGQALAAYLAALARAYGIPVVSTGGAGGWLVAHGYAPVRETPLFALVQRLTDPEWRGIDGKGGHDLFLIAGQPYAMAQTALSGLKHFAPGVKTLSLERVYHPNASWSLPNLAPKEYVSFLVRIAERVEA